MTRGFYRSFLTWQATPLPLSLSKQRYGARGWLPRGHIAVAYAQFVQYDAVPSRQELYPKGTDAACALKLSQGALLGVSLSLKAGCKTSTARMTLEALYCNRPVLCGPTTKGWTGFLDLAAYNASIKIPRDQGILTTDPPKTVVDYSAWEAATGKKASDYK